eukprot:GHVN01037389.1.p1 GENE.GHVN01037389.1~~GHVN01037389.1.p1  ORF type:complete len:170 (-),score=47.72 GHVN01037389.1:276-785(-)
MMTVLEQTTSSESTSLTAASGMNELNAGTSCGSVDPHKERLLTNSNLWELLHSIFESFEGIDGMRGVSNSPFSVRRRCAMSNLTHSSPSQPYRYCCQQRENPSPSSGSPHPRHSRHCPQCSRLLSPCLKTATRLALASVECLSPDNQLLPGSSVMAVTSVGALVVFDNQ